MSDNISEININSKEIIELKIQLTAHMSIITNLNKKNKELQEENEHLQKLLNGAIPILKSSGEISTNVKSGEEPEVDICRLEISKLLEKSIQEQLTYEDSKRLEVYTKILNNSKNAPKIIELTAKKLSNDDLLLTLESGIDDK